MLNSVPKRGALARKPETKGGQLSVEHSMRGLCTVRRDALAKDDMPW